MIDNGRWRWNESLHENFLTTSEGSGVLRISD
jgi:hypothetical protein